ALRIPYMRGVFLRDGHHPLPVAAERRISNRRRMSLEQTVEPRGECAACQLAFWFSRERRGPGEPTGGRIGLQRVTHGTVEQLAIQCPRGAGREHVDLASRHIIPLPSYIADHRQYQSCYAAQQPRETPLQPCRRPEPCALLS